MLYVVERNNETYVTEDESIVSKLTKIPTEGIKEVTLEQVIAHFLIDIPERKITISEHPTYSEALRVSDPSALLEYIEEAETISRLGQYDPKRANWEEKRDNNVERLRARLHKKDR